MNEKDHFLQQVERTIRVHRLLTPDRLYLLGLSGGADSVALACCLTELGYRFEAVHCNFELRGAESERDEAFVRDFCSQRGIPLHVRHFQTIDYSAKEHVSIEMAARDLRYGWFRTLLSERGAAGIIVAHHQDDNAETLLLHLIRGTGIKGLCGMKYRNGDILRPFLDSSRAAIMRYLAAVGQSYVTDSTNLERDAVRNRIRLDILPLLRQINPSVGETLHELARHVSGAEQLYRRALGKSIRRVCHDGIISLSALREEADAAETVLYEILAPMGFNSVQVRSVYEQRAGAAGQVYESKTWRLLCDRDSLICQKKDPAAAELQASQLPEEGLVTVTSDLSLLVTGYPASSYVIKKQKDVLCLDADKVALPLQVRHWQRGDRFYPFGMNGSKLVSDFLTDRKKNRFQKEAQLVLVHGTDIVWVVGERPDRRFSVDSQTRRILEVRAVVRDEAGKDAAGA